MSNQQLIDVYRAMLDTAGLYVDDEGYVSYRVAKDKMRPYLVKGKRLVLPMREHLTKDVEETVRFHPLSENILKGESDVMEKYRTALLVRLNSLAWHIFEQLVRLAGSKTDMHRLNPEQSEFLSMLKDVDEKSLTDLLGIRDAYVKKHQLSRSILSIYIRKDAKLDDRSYFRAGITTFPLYKDLLDKEEADLTKKLRAKDRKQFTAFIEAVFPQLKDNPGWYSRGSNSKIAPSTDALLNTVATIAASLNSVCDLFEKQIDDRITTEGWEEQLTDLSSFERYVRLVPPQPGNEGKDDQTEQPVGTDISTLARPATVAQANPVVPPAPVVPTAAIPTPAPTVPLPGKPRSRLEELLAQAEIARQAPAPQQPMYQQPVYQQPVQPTIQQPVDNRPPWMRGASTQPVMPGYNQPMPQGNGLVPMGCSGPTNNYLMPQQLNNPYYGPSAGVQLP